MTTKRPPGCDDHHLSSTAQRWQAHPPELSRACGGLASRTQRHGDFIDHISMGMTAFFALGSERLETSACPSSAYIILRFLLSCLLASERLGLFCFMDITARNRELGHPFGAHRGWDPGWISCLHLWHGRLRYRRTYWLKRRRSNAPPTRQRSESFCCFLSFPLYSLGTNDTEAGFRKDTPHTRHSGGQRLHITALLFRPGFSLSYG